MIVDALSNYWADSHPTLLTVETSSACNLRCVMCPHVIGAVHRPKQMEQEVFDKLERPLAEAKDIQLHGIGEPLLSAAFWRYLRQLDGRSQANVSFNSNFTRLTDAQIDTILRAGVHLINVSLDAATPETYRRIRNFDFAQVLGNVSRLLAARNARGVDRPVVVINMTLMRANIEELPEFVRLGKRLGVDQVAFWAMNEGQDWSVERDGWRFDYREQLLQNNPSLSNRTIREAMRVGHDIGMPLAMDFNKVIFFEEPVA